METLKNDQCTGCAHAVMCKYISDCRYILDDLPANFRISVYCPLFHPKNSSIPRGFAK